MRMKNPNQRIKTKNKEENEKDAGKKGDNSKKRGRYHTASF